jgi:hypothetical protein
MSPYPVTIDGVVYPTLEHFYHVMVGSVPPPKQTRAEFVFVKLSLLSCLQKFIHARTVPIKFESVEQMKTNPVVAKILSISDPAKVKQLMGKKGMHRIDPTTHSCSETYGIIGDIPFARFHW